MKIDPLNPNHIFTDRSVRSDFSIVKSSAGKERTPDILDISAKAHQLLSLEMQPVKKSSEDEEIGKDQLKAIWQRIGNNHYGMEKIKKKIATSLSNEPGLIRAFIEARDIV